MIFQFFFKVIEKLFVTFWGDIDMVRWGKRSFKELVIGFTSGNEHEMKDFGFIKGFRDREGSFLPVNDWVYFSKAGIA